MAWRFRIEYLKWTTHTRPRLREILYTRLIMSRGRYSARATRVLHCRFFCDNGRVKEGARREWMLFLGEWEGYGWRGVGWCDLIELVCVYVVLFICVFFSFICTV